MKHIRKILGLAEHPTHAPNSQPHPTLRHLKLTLTSDEYEKQITNKYLVKSDLPESLWTILPNYLIARCPLCQASYAAILDTHSLHFWATLASKERSIFDEKHQSIGCDHFVAVHSFVNLNGIFPSERSKYFHNDYDVPFITPLFIPDETSAYAVIHSLPICRIENGQFVPRYAVYFLTYYAPEGYIHWEEVPGNNYIRVRKGILHERRVAEERGEYQGFFYYDIDARQHPDWWDLPLWVKKKKLFWLDPSSPDLSLTNEPVDKFPYSNIQGYRRPIEIRNGRISFLD